MTTGRNSTGPRLAFLGLVAAMAVAAGCTDSRLLTGVYRTTAEAPVVVDGVPGLEGGAYLELVLGEYGPDVAGIIRFYADPDFIQTIGGVCHCRFLTKGRFEGGVLVFAFLDPSSCSQATVDLISARLTESDNGDTLEGPIGRVLATARTARFKRTTAAGDLGSEDKTCDEVGSELPVDSGPGDEAAETGEGAE